MDTTRKSGVLLHPTSLPARWGIGDLGANAYAFVDFLVASGQQLWQVMPLGPTGYGDSPYQSFSAVAGNPLLVSPDVLLSEGLLAAEDLDSSPEFPDSSVDYGAVIPFKMQLLRRSYEHFLAASTPEQRETFAAFRSESSAWLNDYALFAALKQSYGGGAWVHWEPEIRRHEPAAVARQSAALAGEIEFQSYIQWQFFRQWWKLKAYANQHNIQIIGDIPIFVAFDSADVWANPDLFYLDADGNPTVVAGVPPDYFSATGQRWGNPLYRWDVLAQRGYDWWIKRFQSTFSLVDLVRLDHFRGFAAYWEVPASEETAIIGQWVPGPGIPFFEALNKALGNLPIIAEDLGVITPDVEELRDRFGFPGMKVLQFAFSGTPEDPFLPHNYKNRCVVYTGTHDNDTTMGWWQATNPKERSFVQMYLGRDGSDISWDLIRLALASVADTAVVPMQDLLYLGSEARMNFPGRAGGNWGWRYTLEMLSTPLAERLHLLTGLYGRLKVEPQEEEEIDEETARRMPSGFRPKKI